MDIILKHYMPLNIINNHRPIEIVLIGAGGTGSQLITGLARINQALKALGGPGINLAVVDGDAVSESNVGRQLFSPADIGRNKAVVLTTRMNMFFGTHWRAYSCNLTGTLNLTNMSCVDIFISAVDNVQTRVQIGEWAKGYRNAYWLDTGNTTSTGQAILGTTRIIGQPEKNSPEYLPHVLDLYEGIMKEEANKLYQGPSCSVADALSRQDLFVNQWVATAALEIIWNMFRRGYITAHGAFISLNPMSVRALPVNPVVWEAMGWKLKTEGKKSNLKKAA